MEINVIKSLNDVSLKNHVYSLDKTVLIEKNETAFNFAESPLFKLNNILPKRFYSLMDRIFVYASDNYVYEITEEEAIKACDVEFTTEPKLITVKKNGADEILILGEDVFYLIDKKESVSAVPLNLGVFVLGRLFFSKDNRLRVSMPYPFEENNENAFNDGEIVIDSEYGKILALNEVDNCVIIFTEKAVFRLKVIGESFEYELNKVQTFYLDILEESIVKIGDYVYFISGNELLVYKNGKIERFKTLSPSNAILRACSLLEFYLIDAIGSQEFNAINTITKEVKTLKKFEMVFLDYGYSALDNKLYKIVKSDGMSIVENQRSEITLDFDTNKSKSIIEVEVFTKQVVCLKISGDFGEQEYLLDGDNSVIKCNLSSKKFLLSFIKNSVVPDKINITYRIYGE